MAQSVLFEYKKKFGILPSRPSQLIAFSKLNKNVNVITYVQAKSLLATHGKNKPQFTPKHAYNKRVKTPPSPPVLQNSVSAESEDTDYSNRYKIENMAQQQQKNRRAKYKKRQSKYDQNKLNKKKIMNDEYNDDIKNADFGDIEESEEIKKRNRLRKRAVDELVNTERTYLNNLEKLFKVFVNPLKNSDDKKLRKLITMQDHAIIFPSDLSTIYALHIQLNADLIKATTKWNQETSKIGHIFIKYGELFKMYQDYFHKHEKAVHHLAKLERKNSKVEYIFFPFNLFILAPFEHIINNML